MSISVNGIQEATSKLSYITTAAFNGSIYQYTTKLNTSNFMTEGQLTSITTLPSGAAVSSTNCPAGRILRVVGRKLYPGANPGLAVGDKYNGSVVGTTATNHVWVSVFDHITGLRGYIDPNSSGFAVYSTDRNGAFVDSAEEAGGAPTRLGASIYTGGSVTAGTGLTMLGGIFNQYKSINALAGGATSVTTTQLLGSIVTQAASANQNLTLPSTASIILALGSTVGASCEFIYWNTTNTVTLTAADVNTTLVGTATFLNRISRATIVVTSATTIVIYIV